MTPQEQLHAIQAATCFPVAILARLGGLPPRYLHNKLNAANRGQLKAEDVADITQGLRKLSIAIAALPY